MPIITCQPAPPDRQGTVTCASCQACCCRLEVLVIGDPDVPDRYTTENDWGGTAMRRLDDGWCAALDRDTMRCTIYAQRPQICRDFEMGGADCRETRAASDDV